MNSTELHDAAPRALRAGQRNPWLLTLRILATVSILSGLFLYYDISQIFAHLNSIDSSYATAALFIIAVQYLLSSLRWHYILHRHDLPLTFRRSFSIYGIGALANLVLVTSLAGISVRGLLLLREKLDLSRIVGVLFVERVAAAGGMGLCILLSVGLSYRPLLGHLMPDPRFESGVAYLAVAMFATAVAVFLLWRLKRVREFVDQIRKSFLSLKVVAFLVVMSSAIIFLGFAGVALIGRGMGINIDPLFFVTAMPVIALLASLPITVGGWGVREGVMLVGLGVFGVEAESALALSVAYGFAGVLVTCIFGSLALLWYMSVWRTRRQPVSSADGK